MVAVLSLLPLLLTDFMSTDSEDQLSEAQIPVLLLKSHLPVQRASFPSFPSLPVPSFLSEMIGMAEPRSLGYGKVK